MEENLQEIIRRQGIYLENINIGFSDYENLILSGNAGNLKEFMHKALSLNENEAYADFYYSRLTEKEKKDFEDALTVSEKLYFQEFKDRHEIYYPLNHELLEFLLGITIREVLFSTFYFCKVPATVWGNYDLKFPMFFKDKEQKELYIQLAEENGLSAI